MAAHVERAHFKHMLNEMMDVLANRNAWESILRLEKEEVMQASS